MRGADALLALRLPVLAAAFTLASLSAAGCATVGEAQDPTSHADGDNASVQGILLRDIFVLGPMPGETVPAGGTAQIYLTLINQNAEPDRLISVAAPDVARSVQITGGPIALPPGAVVHPGEDGPTLVLEDLTTQLRGGDYIRLTFRFAEAGTVGASVPVMPYANFYTTYPAAPNPTG